jgi:hypothetical protein
VHGALDGRGAASCHWWYGMDKVGIGFERAGMLFFDINATSVDIEYVSDTFSLYYRTLASASFALITRCEAQPYCSKAMKSALGMRDLFRVPTHAS